MQGDAPCDTVAAQPPTTADAMFSAEARAEQAACAAHLPDRPVEVGVPGASLAREYHRCKDAREADIRARHTNACGLILALSDEPASTAAFAAGAAGERAVTARLEKVAGDQVLFLHNRRLGRGRRDGDVDHIAIAPWGGCTSSMRRTTQTAAARVRRSGGLFSPRAEKALRRRPGPHPTSRRCRQTATMGLVAVNVLTNYFNKAAGVEVDFPYVSA